MAVCGAYNKYTAIKLYVNSCSRENSIPGVKHSTINYSKDNIASLVDVIEKSLRTCPEDPSYTISELRIKSGKSYISINNSNFHSLKEIIALSGAKVLLKAVVTVKSSSPDRTVTVSKRTRRRSVIETQTRPKTIPTKVLLRRKSTTDVVLLSRRSKRLSGNLGDDPALWVAEELAKHEKKVRKKRGKDMNKDQEVVTNAVPFSCESATETCVDAALCANTSELPQQQEAAATDGGSGEWFYTESGTPYTVDPSGLRLYRGNPNNSRNMPNRPRRRSSISFPSALRKRDRSSDGPDDESNEIEQSMSDTEEQPQRRRIKGETEAISTSSAEPLTHE